LPHIVLGDDTEPLTLTRLAGEAKLHAGNVEINDAQLDSENDVYRLGGTVSLKGEVDLKLARIASGAAAAGYAITGTLAEPQVAPLKDAEQARLKR